MRAFALLLALVTAPAAAQLESAALLVSGAEEPEEAVEARGAVRTALTDGGCRVEEVVPPAIRSCRPGTGCAAAVLAQAGADWVVTVTLWTHPRRGPDAVTITLENAAGDLVSHLARNRRGIASAARDALAGALARLALPEGPFLAVEGAPAGATVTLSDGQSGTLPALFRVAPGTLTATVSADGRQTAAETVAVAMRPTAVARVAVDLAPDTATMAPEPPATVISSLNFLLAGALVVLAVPPLAAGIYAYATDGQCAEQVGGACVSRVAAGAQAGLWVGLGAAAAVAGIAIAVWRPIRVEARPAPGGASLRLAADF
jgi:hypothetical protein